MCDIKAMFHQVQGQRHSSWLPPILVVDDENFNSDPVEYWMIVHVFSAISSPGCTNFALKTTANQYEEKEKE